MWQILSRKKERQNVKFESSQVEYRTLSYVNHCKYLPRLILLLAVELYTKINKAR
jgi:hypothetical protein